MVFQAGPGPLGLVSGVRASLVHRGGCIRGLSKLPRTPGTPPRCPWPDPKNRVPGLALAAPLAGVGPARPRLGDSGVCAPCEGIDRAGTTQDKLNTLFMIKYIHLSRPLVPAT